MAAILVNFLCAMFLFPCCVIFLRAGCPPPPHPDETTRPLSTISLQLDAYFCLRTLPWCTCGASRCAQQVRNGSGRCAYRVRTVVLLGIPAERMRIDYCIKRFETVYKHGVLNVK